MNLHCSRSLVMSRSCCVVTPPQIIFSIMSMYFFLGVSLLQLPEILDRQVSLYVKKTFVVVPHQCQHLSPTSITFQIFHITPPLSNWFLALSFNTTSCLMFTSQSLKVVLTKYMISGLSSSSSLVGDYW